jgi:hypothetical protein
VCVCVCVCVCRFRGRNSYAWIVIGIRHGLWFAAICLLNWLAWLAGFWSALFTLPSISSMRTVKSTCIMSEYFSSCVVDSEYFCLNLDPTSIQNDRILILAFIDVAPTFFKEKFFAQKFPLHFLCEHTVHAFRYIHNNFQPKEVQF